MHRAQHRLELLLQAKRGATPHPSSTTMAATTTLALPGAAALQVAQPTNGREKLDPRFLAMLLQAKITDSICDTLGNADVDSAALFGSMGAGVEEKVLDYFKDVLNIDPTARPAELVMQARLLMVWKACKLRADIETKAAIERSLSTPLDAAAAAEES